MFLKIVTRINLLTSFKVIYFIKFILHQKKILISVIPQLSLNKILKNNVIPFNKMGASKEPFGPTQSKKSITKSFFYFFFNFYIEVPRHDPISTIRYFDVISTFFGRYERQMDVKTTMCAYWGPRCPTLQTIHSIKSAITSSNAIKKSNSPNILSLRPY